MVHPGYSVRGDDEVATESEELTDECARLQGRLKEDRSI